MNDYNDLMKLKLFQKALELFSNQILMIQNQKDN